MKGYFFNQPSFSKNIFIQKLFPPTIEKFSPAVIRGVAVCPEGGVNFISPIHSGLSVSRRAMP